MNRFHNLVSGVVLATLVMGLGSKDSSAAEEPKPAGPGEPSPTTWSLEFSPDGKYLAAACGLPRTGGGVIVWNTADWTPHFTHVEETGCADVSFSRDSAVLAYCTCGTWAGLFDIPNGKLLKRFEHGPTRLFAVEMSADGRSLITGAKDDLIKFWNVETGKLDRTFAGHKGTIYDLQASADGELLLSCGSDRTLRLWDAHSGESRATYNLDDFEITRISLSADGRVHAVAMTDLHCRIYDTATGFLRADFRGGKRAAELSSDAKLLVTSGSAGSALVYRIDLEEADPETVRGIKDLLQQFEDDSIDVRDAALSELIAFGLPAVPTLMETLDSPLVETRVRARRARREILAGQPIAELPGHLGEVEVVCFSPDGQTIATADRQGGIKLWETGTWKHLRDLANPIKSVMP